jgi:hypothetical protein
MEALVPQEAARELAPARRAREERLNNVAFVCFILV